MPKKLKKHLSIKKRSKSKKYNRKVKKSRKSIRKVSRKVTRKVKKSRKSIRKNDGIDVGDLVSYTKGGWFEKPRSGRIIKRDPNRETNCPEGNTFDIDNMNGNIDYCIKPKNIKVKNLTYSEQQKKI
jgi:hypothetical protein